MGTAQTLDKDEPTLYYGLDAGMFNDNCTDEHKEEIRKALLDTETSFLAYEYSCDQRSDVGIALYVGTGLKDVPIDQLEQWFIELYKNNGLKAKVFIEQHQKPGSAMSFYASGTLLHDHSLQPGEAQEKARYLVYEAKLIFFINVQIKASINGKSLQWLRKRHGKNSDLKRWCWRRKINASARAINF